MSCDLGCRHRSDLALLWLWCRPAATAPIRPLAWEPPYAAGEAQEMASASRPLVQAPGAGNCFLEVGLLFFLCLSVLICKLGLML